MCMNPVTAWLLLLSTICLGLSKTYMDLAEQIEGDE